MRRPGPRIDPPPMVVSPELRWLLLRAFGPDGAVWPQHDLDDGRSADVAVRLDLAARIGSRFAAEANDEVGPITAAVVEEARDEAAVQVACLHRLLAEVSSAAAELGTPVLVLKGMAYQLTRSLDPGSRPTGDLDLLAPLGRAQELFDALVGLGLRQASSRGTEYHLPVLLHPHGMVLEIHTHVGYLETTNGEPLDLDFLLDGGRTRPVAGLADGCLLPDEDMLMAHLLGHFLGQHRQSPFGYPLCRMLLDCADLGWDSPRWDSFWDRGYPLIEHLVPRTDVEAVRRLVWRLTKGDNADAIAGGGDHGSRILRHGVLGALDPLYRGRIIGHEITRPTDGGGGTKHFLVSAVRRFWRPRDELEARFGSAGGFGPRCVRRLRGFISPIRTTFRVGGPWLGSVIRDRLGRSKRV